MPDGGATMYLAVASLAMSAVGTGLGVYSGMAAASNQRQVAAYNAEIARQQADMQGMMARRQAEMAGYNASMRAQQAQWEMQIASNNATTLRSQAESVEAQGREEARRMRLEKLRIIGAQKAGYAKAGVQLEGSPLEVLAETDGLSELAVQDMWWQSTNEAKKLRYQAAMTESMGRFEGGLMMASANMDAQNAAFEKQAASAGVRIAHRQAEIERMSGFARAGAMTMGAVSEGVSGAASMARTGYSLSRAIA